jgi:hypothetical protein
MVGGAGGQPQWAPFSKAGSTGGFSSALVVAPIVTGIALLGTSEQQAEQGEREWSVSSCEIVLVDLNHVASTSIFA